MSQTIGYIALVVRDYDEAIAFYTEKLGFTLIEDKPVENKRWVLVAPRGGNSPCLLLARAVTPEQESRLGNQTGGRVFLFLHTDDFQRDYRDLTARGVRFVRPPKEESYGTVAVFEDLYGNKWDLLQLREQPSVFRAAESAHEIDDQTDQQYQSESTAADGRAADVKPAATEQEKENDHE